jgi:hypothetical protein
MKNASAKPPAPMSFPPNNLIPKPELPKTQYPIFGPNKDKELDKLFGF